MKTVIIYEDKDILVIQKPSGLATQTAKVGQADVVSELKNYLAAQKNGYLGVIHRLDQPVEGLLVFAKNKKAAGNLSKQLQLGTLHKQYYAVVCGLFPQKQGELVDYLRKEDNYAKVVTGKQAQYPDAQKAVLQYRILQEINEPWKLALADIHIDTGRFHQIRAQMAHAGMPLLGDTKYAEESMQEPGRSLGVRNVALCAYHLTFQHPATNKQMSFQIRPEGKAFAYFESNNFGLL
ncbi:MAG: RluA family pseudouridine synthase [Lachnospiraceae bacterium]|nr:RluA family pseudouridine synthase [Lachnospiraceae bacterium]